MTDHQFALATVIVSGGFGVVVAAITSLLTRRADISGFHRELRRQRVDDARRMYEDVAAFIQKTFRQRGIVNAEEHDAIDRITARVQLSASDNVLKAFETYTDALMTWSTIMQKYQPRHGDFEIVKSGADRYKEEAESCEAKLAEATVELHKAMKAHLETLRREI